MYDIQVCRQEEGQGGRAVADTRDGVRELRQWRD